MNQRAIDVLEYSRIINELAKRAGSEMTRTVISGFLPGSNRREIEDALAETKEAVTLLSAKGPMPIGSFYDIEGELLRAKKGGILSMKELLHVLYNMKTARTVVSFLRGDLPPLPILSSMTGLLGVFQQLQERIDDSILSEDEMSDRASPELHRLRRAISQQNIALRRRIDQMIHSSSNKSVLQEAIVTIRDGRYVIPVKTEHRGMVPGIVHDQSASGATLFIEPQVVVDMNNQLRELEMAEEAEVTRILQDLSERVAEYGNRLANNQKLLVHLDIINAKGKLAQDMDATMPVLNEEGILDIKEARHPFIDKKTVVPVSVLLGNSYRQLIITGPNTGGKTVTLKTCGLLAMMAQTGLFIPAEAGSRVPIYKDIFADIGDEQSIEQSLSTFSSHMKTIVEIMEKAGPDTLVLVDELGAGTDPSEGAALAISILETLAARKADVLATTHYNELKKYALSTEGIENASMEFDVATLSPTYRLIIGTPGKSNAFAISEKLGLPPEIIRRAKTLMEGEDLHFEDVLSGLEEDRRNAEKDRIMAKRILERVQEEKKAFEKQQKENLETREQVLQKAREKARGIVNEAKEFSKDIQEELRQLSKMESMGERSKGFDASRKKIKDAAGRYKERVIKEVNDRPVDIKDIKIGDRVKVVSLHQNGEILSLADDKDQLQVQVGMMKIRVKADDLQLIVEGRQKKLRNKQKASKSHYSSLTKSKAQSVGVSVDVRGQNLEDAIYQTEKYMDDAFMAGLKEVTVIHGRGEGILQSGIRQALKKNRHVEEFRPGEYNEGGQGVTIVQLKK